MQLALVQSQRLARVFRDDANHVEHQFVANRRDGALGQPATAQAYLVALVHLLHAIQPQMVHHARRKPAVGHERNMRFLRLFVALAELMPEPFGVVAHVDKTALDLQRVLNQAHIHLPRHRADDDIRLLEVGAYLMLVGSVHALGVNDFTLQQLINPFRFLYGSCFVDIR
jgi:hypothetical protein